MKNLDNEIKKVLADNETLYDLDKEEGVFRQMAGLFHTKVRWMAIVAVIESIACIVLAILAINAFFNATETKWLIMYATCVLLITQLLLLIKLWGWMQMVRYSIQRDLKRLELRILEMHEKE